MDLQLILDQAKTLGITLTVTGGRIRYSPKSRTPSDFVELLRTHKSELVTYLHQQKQEPAQACAYLPQVFIEAQQVAAINCGTCGQNNWWLRRTGGVAWVCVVCHPEPDTKSAAPEGVTDWPPQEDPWDEFLNPEEGTDASS